MVIERHGMTSMIRSRRLSDETNGARQRRQLRRRRQGDGDDDMMYSDTTAGDGLMTARQRGQGIFIVVRNILIVHQFHILTNSLVSFRLSLHDEGGDKTFDRHVCASVRTIRCPVCCFSSHGLLSASDVGHLHVCATTNDEIAATTRRWRLR